MDDCEGFGHVEAGGLSFVIVDEQRVRLEERLLGELGKLGAPKLHCLGGCLGGCLGLLGLLHELDGAAGCYRGRG